MKNSRFRRRPFLAAALSLWPAVFAASCVSETHTAAVDAETTSVQPRQANYDCGPDGALSIENLKTSVKVVDPTGENVELPASPATQQSRYGETPYALVLDGKDALYMKSGREPVACHR